MHKTPRCLLSHLLLAALVLLPLLVSPPQAAASPASDGDGMGEIPSQLIFAEEGGENAGRKLLPAVNYLQAEVSPSSTIQVIYRGDWDPDAKAAFEYAKKIWETRIASPVPIVVEARWDNLNYISPYVLGGASASNYRSNFTGAVYMDTWYPVALANKLYGNDLEPDWPDIEASFNSAFPAWYFGTDGNPGFAQYDFVSVVLHEIGHGLGFSGSMSWNNQRGSWGLGSAYPIIYDRFVTNGFGESLIDTYANHSRQLGTELTCDDLYFSGSRAVEANDGVPPKLYAPKVWKQGSSYSHLDERTYPANSGNALMTPTLANGEVIHDPGPITMGIFEDIGWGEDTSPVNFQRTSIYSYSSCGYYSFLPSVHRTVPVQAVR